MQVKGSNRKSFYFYIFSSLLNEQEGCLKKGGRIIPFRRKIIDEKFIIRILPG